MEGGVERLLFGGRWGVVERACSIRGEVRDEHEAASHV